jgi:hypothetical protein
MKIRSIYAAFFSMALLIIGSGIIENVLSPKWKPTW